MHVLLLPQVFPPEMHPTAVMFGELAAALAAAGHRVTVACGFPHHPTGQVQRGYRKRLYLRENIKGVEIIRAWHLTSTRRDLLSRGAVMASQALAAALASQFIAPPDLVVNIGPPLVGTALAAATARRFGAPLASVVFDVYPEVAINSGKIRSPIAIQLLRSGQNTINRFPTKFIVLSDGLRKQLMQKGIPSHRVEIIPIWLDTSDITPMSRETTFRRELGLDANSFVVLYAGTLGLVSGAAVVAEAARLVRNPRVRFLFVGSGDARAEVEAITKLYGLRNVIFTPFQPRERLSEVQATGDVGLVTLAPGMAKTSVPSKVLGYMAAARPVLASVDIDSDTGRLVNEIGGTVVPPANPAALAAAIDVLAEADLSLQGATARKKFEESFTAEAAVPAYISLFERLAADGR